MVDEILIRGIISTAFQANEFLGKIDKLYRESPNDTIGNTLDEFYCKYNKLEKSYSEEHRFLNQYQAFLSSLGIFLVIYHGLDSQVITIPTIRMDRLSERWGLKGLPQIDACSTLYQFIKCLRDALSHWQVEVSEQLFFSFSCEGKRKRKKEKVTICLTGKQLRDFTKGLSYCILTRFEDVELKELYLDTISYTSGSSPSAIP